MKFIDSYCLKNKKQRIFDWPLAKYIRERKNQSILFGRLAKTDDFCSDSLNIHFIRSDKNHFRPSLDGFFIFEKRIPVKYVIRYRKQIFAEIKQNLGGLEEYLEKIKEFSPNRISPVKAWNLSIVMALFFGMFIMSSIYRYLGQDAAAISIQSSPGRIAQSEILIQEKELTNSGKVLGASDDLREIDSGGVEEVAKYVEKIMKNLEKEPENKKRLREEIERMVKGYPIENMTKYIADQDPVIAAFLVGIAKKESNWGKRVPVLNGEDCFNYWGYRGIRKRMGSGGHTCFDSPEDAVKTVSKRLKNLVSSEKIETPKEMVVVWKCGYDCSWDSPAAVRKWVTDVDHYFGKFDKFVK